MLFVSKSARDPNFLRNEKRKDDIRRNLQAEHSELAGEGKTILKMLGISILWKIEMIFD